MLSPEIKLVAIMGPTASGKSDLALGIATKYNGEIVCADSRTVYRGLDIGSAKPTAADRAAVPHHLLDIADPDQTVSVAEFKILAEAAISDIAARGKLPLLVGGSGLYVDSVLFDYTFPEAPSSELRNRLSAMNLDDLNRELDRLDPGRTLAIDRANSRRVTRAIETMGLGRTRQPVMRANTLALGLTLNKQVMQERIAKRIEIMLSQGFFEEVTQLANRYGWECEALSGIGYRAFRDAAAGRMDIASAAELFARGDHRLVKKQLTWFRRNPEIMWLESPDQAWPLVADFLKAPVSTL